MEGQIYIPEANWAMMVLTLLVVAGFRDQLAISNAYGARSYPCAPTAGSRAELLQAAQAELEQELISL